MSTALKEALGAPAEAIFDLRNSLDWLDSEGDLVKTDVEVDPDLELTGVQKHLDGGCPMLFENVRHKPNHRVVTNLFGDMAVINKMFGWADDTDRTRKLAHALSNPVKPVVVPASEAPSQQHVIENPVDVNEYMVPIRHTEYEPELTVGSGNRVVTGEYFGGGSDLGYNRMNFRWGNVGTFQISPGSHMWQVVSKHYKDDKPVPITMCFGVPPSCTLLAGAGFDYVILPQGCDEIGIAGAIQGSPVRDGQGADGGRAGAGRLRGGARRLRQPARPPLRDRRGRGGGRPGALPLPPRMGGLYGQVLQGADLPRHRGDDARPGDQADHLRPRRPHARRPQHRHHGARGGDVRAVRAPPAGDRPGRGHPLLHDRLGRGGHPGEEAQPDRRRLAAQLHVGHPLDLAGVEAVHRGQRGHRPLRHGRRDVVHDHPRQPAYRHPEPDPGRGAARPSCRPSA